mgnify:CR=1 FL=1
MRSVYPLQLGLVIALAFLAGCMMTTTISVSPAAGLSPSAASGTSIYIELFSDERPFHNNVVASFPTGQQFVLDRDVPSVLRDAVAAALRARGHPVASTPQRGAPVVKGATLACDVAISSRFSRMYADSAVGVRLTVYSPDGEPIGAPRVYSASGRSSSWFMAWTPTLAVQAIDQALLRLAQSLASDESLAHAIERGTGSR